MHTTPCHYAPVVLQETVSMESSYWRAILFMSDVEDKAFLQENISWYKTYLPVIKETLEKFKQENPTKPTPSLSLVLAVIKQESNGRSWANRFEPSFRNWLASRLGAAIKKFGVSISKDTELHNRATSFGLMQIMGQTARERGFSGEYLTELCKPEVGIYYGIKHLAELLERYKTEDQYISAYNAGSPTTANKMYVQSVKRYKDSFENILTLTV